MLGLLQLLLAIFAIYSALEFSEELKLFEAWLNQQAPKFSFDTYLTPQQKSRALNEALKGKK